MPDPALIFVILIAALALASWFAAAAELSAVHPRTGETLLAESLFSTDNLRRLLVEMPQTFTAFPPLGLVIVIMLGAAVAERSGLFAALISRTVIRAPRSWLTPVTFVVALLSHHASDAAYVVLVPLAAMLYHQAGRHPLVGIAVAYAGISGAFAANLLPGQFDVLILGITQSAAQLIDPQAQLNPLGNWWFTATLAAVLFFVGWWVTETQVAPRLEGSVDGSLRDADTAHPSAAASSHPNEAKGLRNAALGGLAVIAAIAALVFWPGGSPLVDATASGPAQYAPFYKSLVAGFMILFLVTGWCFGRAVGTVRTHRDAVGMMTAGLKELTPYFVLAFFAAHFIAMFGWSNLGPIIAIHGAEWLRSLDVGTALILLPLLLLSMIFDLLIGSASAKWSAMAPIVVPMLMLVGISPEMTTAAFRVGDSIVNIITPIAANFVLVLVICQRWRNDFGIGSLIALMLPYSVAFGIAGAALVALWAGFALPLGPGAPALLPVVSGAP